jgi:hypothetical protein
VKPRWSFFTYAATPGRSSRTVETVSSQPLSTTMADVAASGVGHVRRTGGVEVDPVGGTLAVGVEDRKQPLGALVRGDDRVRDLLYRPLGDVVEEQQPAVGAALGHEVLRAAPAEHDLVGDAVVVELEVLPRLVVRPVDHRVGDGCPHVAVPGSSVDHRS